jgi:hypothetical protein
MSQLEKLIKKFFEKPVRNDLTVNEVIKLANHFGCIVLTGGNHQIRIAHKPSGTVIPLPQHGKCVKEAYIIELRKLFDEIISEQGGDNK